MPITFKPASRQGVKPLICLYSESGCGKTYSALLLARGMVGPKGRRIFMGDTESGRGELYADVIPGGYDVAQMSAPFSPASYIAVIEAAEAAQAEVLILDSMSHEWEGLGGVLDMAGENEAKSGRAGLHNWRAPKLEHNKLVLKLLQTKLMVICCIRAKFKTRQGKDERGKTVIVKDDFTSPIQSEEFIFEATAHMEILGNHTIRLTKCSHPALRECFPKDNTEPLAIQHGEAIARWAAGGATSAPQKAKEKPPMDARAAAAVALWKAANPKFDGDKAKFTAWLREKEHLSADQEIASLTAEQMTALLPIVEAIEFNF